MTMAFWSGVAPGGKATKKLLLEVQHDLQGMQKDDVQEVIMLLQSCSDKCVHEALCAPGHEPRIL